MSAQLILSPGIQTYLQAGLFALDERPINFHIHRIKKPLMLEKIFKIINSKLCIACVYIYEGYNIPNLHIHINFLLRDAVEIF